MFTNNTDYHNGNNNKFDQKYQDQIELVFNYWKNFDIKTLQVRKKTRKTNATIT
jgi:hypothetical protein